MSYADYEVPEAPTAATATPSVSPVSNAATATATPAETEEGVAYNPISRTPPCAGISSTCITSQTIANAKHAFVQDSPVKSYISLLSPPDEENQECQAPTKTGVKVYRPVLKDGEAKYDKYDDSFCLNQGCVYFGLNGEHKCE
jgi:hypothetical protein